ncbi:MAG: TolC family protein [Limisphaerales bacterium]
MSAGLMLVLSGCASTSKRSSTQSLKAEDTARSHEQVGVATSSRKQLPELNEASGLNDYLAYAALNNPQLEAAFNRWKAALEMVSQARTLPGPRFNYGYFIQEVETRVGPQEQRVGLSQMFPWFGKLRLRGEAALEGANAMQQQYEAAKLRLFDEVKQAYYELYFVGRAVGVTAENVELLKLLEEMARSKYESGTAEHGDVIKAQVELDKLRDRLRTLQDFNHPLVARLNAALNRPTESSLPFPTNNSPGVLQSGIAQLLEQLKASNPELKSLDFLAEKDKANIALAKKEFYPDVTLGVDYVQTGEARMAAYAEGLSVLRDANIGKQPPDPDAETTPLRDPGHYQYDLNLGDIAEVWRRGSVIASWLLDLTADALARDSQLSQFAGRVSDSGEGRWTIKAAIDEGVPVPVLTTALYARFASRGEADFQDKVLSAMRYGFGGHLEKSPK